jgi:hypothetical protein
MNLTRFLKYDEYRQLIKETLAAASFNQDVKVFTPGMVWEMPWIFDPTGEREKLGIHVMYRLRDRGKLGFLSKHYWTDWSFIRPPLCLIGPNGETWQIDRKSSNGDGWKVVGTFPDITCRPSIALDGYHGWLTNGNFSADVEGRGPNGVNMRALEDIMLCIGSDQKLFLSKE